MVNMFDDVGTLWGLMYKGPMIELCGPGVLQAVKALICFITEQLLVVKRQIF